MMIKIVTFITLIAYSVVVSQSFMYILALKNVQMQMDGDAYLQFRKFIDIAMRANLKYVIYLALAGTIVLWVMTIKTPGSFIFIAASIALAALVIDILLALKGNIPINNIINSWTTDNIPSNWQEYRAKWLDIFRYRQIANITGFLSLLAAAVFGTK